MIEGTLVKILWQPRNFGDKEHKPGSESFIIPNSRDFDVAMSYGFYENSGPRGGSFYEGYVGNDGMIGFQLHLDQIQETVEKIVRDGNFKHIPDVKIWQYEFIFDWVEVPENE